jgi:ElaB/YqjD/DUF883 family membrane-anchored ribosome-binding protein
MLETTRTPGGTPLSDAAQDPLTATTQAVGSSREPAGEAAGRIGESARELRDSAADFARTRAESVVAAANAAQRRVGMFARTTRRRVEDAPMKSVLIAAAAGSAVALVLSFFSRRDAE